MLSYNSSDTSLSDLHESVDATKHQRQFKSFLAFAGPAYLVSVGYMDPGNWATDLQGGAQFGYKLIWILLMSNLMALLLQNLSARLGIVRRRDLAQANREVYPPLINFCLYILAELAIAACDLAEVLGMAIGIQLLTGLPITWGVCITVADTFLLFYLQKAGIKKMEAFIIALVALIGISFLIEIFIAKPELGEVAKGFIPTSLSTGALYIAVAIIGATVMPHNLYLHSALVQTRKIKKGNEGIKQALRFNLIDSTVALNIAFLVNASMLILAAKVFFFTGHTDVARIEDAYKLLQPMLGSKIAPFLFAIALIAAGQSSTVTGTLAGQIVMEGYLRLRINPLLRRLITRLVAITPALIVILIYGESQLDFLLVLSQVILSVQLGFAVIPLIHFVSDKSTMGSFRIKFHTQIIAWLVASILIFLNVRMVAEQIVIFFNESENIFFKGLIIITALLFVWLFLMMTFLPFTRKHKERISAILHGEQKKLLHLTIPEKNIIAVALDFSDNDEKIIAYALDQGKKQTSYILLHVVETVSAKYYGESADDYETRKDHQRLDAYAVQLSDMGYSVQTRLGFKNRIKEIVRIVKEDKADLLIMGAHHHTGLKDFLYGETVDKVRHKLNIPVFIVN